MKALKTIWKKGQTTTRNIRSNVQRTALLASCTLMASTGANAAGLDKAKGLLEKLRDELLTIIPIAAIIILILFGIAYAFRMMEKDTFVRWAIGILIAGSAAEIVALLFS